MKTETIQQIEQALQVELPGFYLNAIRQSLEEPEFEENNLVRDADWIVEENQKLRKEGFYGEEWPDHLFAIGHDFFGNYFFINLEEEDEAVYIADHEEDFDCDELDEMLLASNMKEYIEQVMEDLQF